MRSFAVIQWAKALSKMHHVIAELQFEYLEFPYKALEVSILKSTPTRAGDFLVANLSLARLSIAFPSTVLRNWWVTFACSWLFSLFTGLCACTPFTPSSPVSVNWNSKFVVWTSFRVISLIPIRSEYSFMNFYLWPFILITNPKLFI